MAALPLGHVHRRLAPVSWHREGYRILLVLLDADVPSFDDSLIRAALQGAALSSGNLAALERRFNRELWPLGYAARVEPSRVDESAVSVKVERSE